MTFSFKLYIQQLVKKLKIKFNLYFRTLHAKMSLISATFCLRLDYGDFLFMHVSSKCYMLWALYRLSLFFTV